MPSTSGIRFPFPIVAFAAALSLIGGLLAPPGLMEPALAIQPGTTVLAGHSGQALDVSGASVAAGAPVIQWPRHDGGNQRWLFEPLGDGTYRIVAAHTGQVLDVAGASQAAGAPVVQWPWHGGANQRWRIEDVDGPGSRIVSVHTGQALDVSGASHAAGAPVIQWPWHGGPNQRWQRPDVGDNGRLDADDVLSPDIDARPDLGQAAPPMVSVTDVRVARHNGFDRVVFEIGGEGHAGWDVRYVDEARAAGSGFPIEIGGDAVLRVSLQNIAAPPDAPAGVEPWNGPKRLHPAGTGPIAEVVEDTIFEGQHTFFVGAAGRLPFQVYRLGSPQRVVVDMAAR